MNVKPRVRRQRFRESRHTFRRLRCPESRDRLSTIRRLNEALKAHSSVGEGGFAPGERVYLHDEIYRCLLYVLELVDLPIDRYHRWCSFGESNVACSLTRSTLKHVGLDEERVNRLEEALLAIEPFPSKKPVERFQIAKVLEDVGDVWSVWSKDRA